MMFFAFIASVIFCILEEIMSDAYKYNFVCSRLVEIRNVEEHHVNPHCPGEHVQEASQMTKAVLVCNVMSWRSAVGWEEFLLTVYSKHNGSPNELSL